MMSSSKRSNGSWRRTIIGRRNNARQRLDLPSVVAPRASARCHRSRPAVAVSVRVPDPTRIAGPAHVGVLASRAMAGSTPQPSLSAGDRLLGRYRVVERMTEGGHSVVYRVEDER